MGWNAIRAIRPSLLFPDTAAPERFYFVHSYHVVCHEQDDVLARTEYGTPFVSAVERGNIFGTQFHPEKSHANGLCVVHNFVERCRRA